ncbi:MAG: hypothetical protein ACRBB6_04645 [Neptuniibacter sp.]
MKAFFRKLFAPLLNIFESGDEPYSYKKSHRTILIGVGCLFLIITTCVTVAGFAFNQMGAAIPGLVFFTVGVTCLIVAILGSDRAVAKIWGNRS